MYMPCAHVGVTGQLSGVSFCHLSSWGKISLAPEHHTPGKPLILLPPPAISPYDAGFTGAQAPHPAFHVSSGNRLQAVRLVEQELLLPVPSSRSRHETLLKSSGRIFGVGERFSCYKSILQQGRNTTGDMRFSWLGYLLLSFLYNSYLERKTLKFCKYAVFSSTITGPPCNNHHLVPWLLFSLPQSPPYLLTGIRQWNAPPHHSSGYFFSTFKNQLFVCLFYV